MITVNFNRLISLSAIVIIVWTSPASVMATIATNLFVGFLCAKWLNGWISCYLKSGNEAVIVIIIGSSSECHGHCRISQEIPSRSASRIVHCIIRHRLKAILRVLIPVYIFYLHEHVLFIQYFLFVPRSPNRLLLVVLSLFTSISQIQNFERNMVKFIYLNGSHR